MVDQQATSSFHDRVMNSVTCLISTNHAPPRIAFGQLEVSLANILVKLEWSLFETSFALGIDSFWPAVLFAVEQVRSVGHPSQCDLGVGVE